MMASLRARLLAAVLALTACGLLLAGAITYYEQRSYQFDRVDQQLRTSVVGVDHKLSPGRGGPAGNYGDPDDHPPGGGPNFGIPAGTYGEKRDASGAVIAAKPFAVNGTVTAKPALPATVPIGKAFTVGGQTGAGTRYRALAMRDPMDGSVTIAAIPLNATDDTLRRLLVVEALVIAAVLIVLGLVSWVVVRVGLLPLDRMGHTAGAIAGGDLSHRVESTDPRTEVGRLGISLNAMLDRLEQAFGEREASEDRLRRFIADASHELRTPLASIRGYAELFRMGATREPADVEKAMRRIEDEAARMGVLVEDLLTLARLDEAPDVPHAELDLAAIVRDAVDDGRAVAPDRRIDVRVDGPAVVVGDRDQLRQVLGNLLRNVFVHTPAGTPVEVSLEHEGGAVRLEVRDHGPGLPTSDAEALFERFWRSEGGRQRGRGGAGLGLAIVAAIVDAHGGDVRAGNAPGGGASFVVTLPAA
jgi:two-component system OmpR family sensor kinase